MIRKHSLLLGFSLAAAVLLPGCSTDLLSQFGGSGEQPLRLSAAPTTGLTRAADGLYTQSSGFDGGEQVEVYVNSSSTHGTYQVNSTSTTALDATNAANTLYYPTTGDVSLYAVYPAASIASHTVKYDQTTEDNYKASDLMYAQKTVTQAQKSNNQELQFGHQLVKLKVQIVKAAGVGSVTKVEMQNVKRKVTVAAGTSSMTLTDLTSASGETGTGANEDKILVFSGSNTSIETQTYAVVFPVQEWADQDFITVTADGQTATYKLTKNDFTFGHEYTLTLNINARALGNTVSIDTWSNGGSAVINPTTSELSIDDIDDQTYSGSELKPSFTIKDASGTEVATISDGNSTSDFDITWQNNTNAGTATVAAVGKTGTAYAGKACAKNFTIQKADASVSQAPTTRILTYTGSAQALVNAGTASGGTLYYQMTTTNSKPSNTDGFSTDIPTDTNHGTYYVWYYVKGDSNHNDTDISAGAVSTTIDKAACSVTLSATSLTIDVGSTGTFTVTRSGNGAITAESSNTSIATTSVNQNTGVVTVSKVATGDATITVTVAESDNYNAYTASDKTVAVSSTPVGAIGGKFSVAANKKVYFSKGNLQYQASTKTWRFAENQWDYVGDGGTTGGNVTGSTNASIRSNYSGWIDLFGWGTSGYQFASGYGTAYQPWSTSTTNAHYGPTDGTSGLTGTYANADWGVYNAISNGGNSAGLWRTLTKDEWLYLFGMTSNDSDASGHARYRKYFRATVNSVKGIVVLPDDISGISDIPAESSRGTSSTFGGKTYTTAAWSALESTGAVFLPAAGYRNGTAVGDAGSYCHYWSTTAYGTSSACRVNFNSGSVDPASSYSRCVGFSVRLVRVAP